MTRELLALMGQGGKIVNIGSGMGHEAPRGGNSSYNVAKAGVQMLTRCLSVELWPQGIDVNEVLPGPVANGLDPEARLAAAVRERQASPFHRERAPQAPRPRRRVSSSGSPPAARTARPDRPSPSPAGRCRGRAKGEVRVSRSEVRTL